MSETSIEWTDRTWNPVRGCSMAPGSETGGCLNCYAARMAARNLPEMRSPTTGEPFAVMRDLGPRWTGRVELIPEKLDEPLRWRKPQRVFVNSMSDLFHEALPDEAIDHVFAAMICAPWHTFQVLTKRPRRMQEYLSRTRGLDNVLVRVNKAARQMRKPSGWRPAEGCAWPYPHVWLGVSVEDQKTADERIPLLLQTPAAKRFVSYEPALGPVDFTAGDGSRSWLKPIFRGELRGWEPAIYWVIVGGESGPGARPFDLAWARSVRDQCRAAGVAFLMKQLGARPIVYHEEAVRIAAAGGSVAWDDSGEQISARLMLSDRKGGDPAEWPEDLRVREFPA